MLFEIGKKMHKAHKDIQLEPIVALGFSFVIFSRKSPCVKYVKNGERTTLARGDPVYGKIPLPRTLSMTRTFKYRTRCE